MTLLFLTRKNSGGISPDAVSAASTPLSGFPRSEQETFPSPELFQVHHKLFVGSKASINHIEAAAARFTFRPKLRHMAPHIPVLQDIEHQLERWIQPSRSQA